MAVVIFLICPLCKKENERGCALRSEISGRGKLKVLKIDIWGCVYTLDLHVMMISDGDRFERDMTFVHDCCTCDLQMTTDQYLRRLLCLVYTSRMAKGNLLFAGYGSGCAGIPVQVDEMTMKC